MGQQVRIPGTKLCDSHAHVWLLMSSVLINRMVIVERNGNVEVQPIKRLLPKGDEIFRRVDQLRLQSEDPMAEDLQYQILLVPGRLLVTKGLKHVATTLLEVWSLGSLKQLVRSRPHLRGD
ncbi:hypothetical protein MMC30_005377 [Trapelia coarctata]|nr:hypothetical protein [Trapelia coarctata]